MTDIEHGPPVNGLSAAQLRLLARIRGLRPDAVPCATRCRALAATLMERR